MSVIINVVMASTNKICFNMVLRNNICFHSCFKKFTINIVGNLLTIQYITLELLNNEYSSNQCWTASIIFFNLEVFKSEKYYDIFLFESKTNKFAFSPLVKLHQAMTLQKDHNPKNFARFQHKYLIVKCGKFLLNYVAKK